MSDTATLTTRPLRHWREMACLTQKELANKAGLTDRTVFHIEKYTKDAKHVSYQTTFRKLAAALGIEVNQIAEFNSVVADKLKEGK